MSALSVSPRAELLRVRGSAQESLHEEARSAADHQFGRRVFVRGVVEVSNFCREDCSYCGMRRSNRELPRFRSDPARLAQVILESRPELITDLNIQTGEDPVATREVVLPLVRALRRESRLGLSVCLGTLDPALYAELREAGASIYIMKFEVGQADRYRRFAAPGTLEERLRHIHHLAETGWHVSSGFIAGLPGETDEQLLGNITLATALPLCGCSVSPFIAGESTALRDAPGGDIDATLNCMALLRRARPDWIIPAVSALNLSEPGSGYRRGLRAGANLVTINLTPETERNDYLLYARDRVIMTAERVRTALESEGLVPSKTSLADHYAARSGAFDNSSSSAASPAGRR